MRRLRSFVPAIWFVLALGMMALAAHGAVQTGSSHLTVYFLDVEQGNCILVVSPSGTAALIDAGTGSRGDGSSDDDPVAFIHRLMDADITFSLQHVIATHYDADHIGKLDDVLQATPPLVAANYRLYTRSGGWVKASSPCDAYRYIEAIGSDHRVAIAPRDVIDLGGGVTLKCCAVGGAYWDGTSVQAASLPADDENGRSIALVLSYCGVKMWFGGDLTEQVELPLAHSGTLPYVDVYAVDHHGANTSSDPSFLQALGPKYAIVQFGQTNTYGHPNKTTIKTIRGVADSNGANPKVIYQNVAPSDPQGRVDNTLADAIADPDGAAPKPGTITITTDGVGPVVVTYPRLSLGATPVKWTLTVSCSPPDGGVTAPAGAEVYKDRTTVSVDAMPKGGYRFDHWEGDVSGTAPSIQVSMTANKTLTAVFAKTPPGGVVVACVLYDGLVKTVESDEYVEIRNYGVSPQDLYGWKIMDISDGYPSLTFPHFLLQPWSTTGKVVRLYTNEIHLETGGFSFGSGRAVWSNSDPDTAALYDASGQLVSQCTYSKAGEGLCASCQQQP